MTQTTGFVNREKILLKWEHSTNNCTSRWPDSRLRFCVGIYIWKEILEWLDDWSCFG